MIRPALFRLGKLLSFERGQSGLAAEIFSPLVEQNSSNPAVLLLRKALRGSKKNYPIAITQLKIRLAARSALPEAHLISWASSTSRPERIRICRPEFRFRSWPDFARVIPAASYHPRLFSSHGTDTRTQAVNHLSAEVRSCQAGLMKWPNFELGNARLTAREMRPAHRKS